MSEYTDKQYEGLAKWLGYIFIAKKDTFDLIPDKAHSHLPLFIRREEKDLWSEFSHWLLTPAGRVAIEDKVIDSGAVCFCTADKIENIATYHIRECHGLARNCYTVSSGPTPAEAWLAAGMKLSEEEDV